MLDNETAIQYAKDLAKFCGEQFCPECPFNVNSHCTIGDVGITPQTWNFEHKLDNLS